MEGKVLSKFFNFMKNFLTMSFLSALAAGAFCFGSIGICEAANTAIKTEISASTYDSAYEGQTVYELNGQLYIVEASNVNGAILIGIKDDAKLSKLVIPKEISYDSTGEGNAQTAIVKQIDAAALSKSTGISKIKVLVMADDSYDSSLNVKGDLESKIAEIYVNKNSQKAKEAVKKLAVEESAVKDISAATVEVPSENNVYFTPGETKVSDIIDKIKFQPPITAESFATGKWQVTDSTTSVIYEYDFSKGNVTTDKPITAGPLKISYVKGESDIYLDSSQPVEVKLVERVKASAKNGTETNKKINYNAGKTKWSDIIAEAKVSPATASSASSASSKSSSTAKGTWKVTDKDKTVVYRSTDSSSETVPSGVTSVTLAYEPGADDEFLAASFDVFLDEKRKTLLKADDFNVKIPSNSAKVTEKIGDISFPEGITVTESSGSAEVKGTWAWKDSTETNITDFISEHIAVYTPEDKETYESLEKTVKVINPGDKVIFGNYSYNVSKDGVTSTIINPGDFKWVREESDGTASWYGFDNSEGALPEGTTLSIEWISKEKEPAKYAEVAEKLRLEGRPVEDDRLWLFHLNAFDANMNEIKDFGGKTLKTYVELGADWDRSDISAFCIDNGIEFINMGDSTEKCTINGEEKEFAVLKMKHFSVYGQSDEQTAKNILEKMIKATYSAMEEYAKGREKVDQDELTKVITDAWNKAYDSLSADEKRIYDKFYDKNGNPKGNSSSTPSSTSTKSTTSSSISKSQASTNSSTSTSSTSSSKIKTGINSHLLSLYSLFGTSALSTVIFRKKKRD